jgi:hypothetical protein
VAATRWTTQQVVDLAPDRASVSAARKLASPGRWSQLGCTPTLVWGRCQGSATQPYQVTVDLTEPAFRCTCPSRKFPCKHGLALLLLWVEHGDAVAEVESAADFAGGVRGRPGGTATRRQSTTEVADPAAQAQREARRVQAMTAGFEELRRWLGDIVRQGLATARRQPYGFWDAMAARLVDARLPGLADRVRALGGAVQARADWADHLLAECGRWYLATRAWERRDTLPAATIGDLRAAVGWAYRADEVARFPTLADRWVVAGVRQGEDGRIISQRTWLWGQRSERWVVVLDFATSAAALGVAHVVGSVVEDRLTLYPGSDPVRAAFSGEQRVVDHGVVPRACSVAAATDTLAAALAANPWRDHLPVAVADAVLADDGGRGSGGEGKRQRAGGRGSEGEGERQRAGGRGASWWLTGPDGGERLALAPGADPWLPLAVSGGRPTTVVAEWQDGALHPMTVLAAGHVVTVTA